MNIHQDHLDLISKIYDLPLQPDLWTPVLDQFAPMVNALGTSVFAFDPIYAEHQVNAVTSSYLKYNSQAIAEYNERFAQEDKEAFQNLMLHSRRGFVSDMESLGISSYEEHADLPVVKWLVDNFFMRHRSASRLSLEGIWTDIIAVQYARDRGPMTQEESELGSLFLEHFAKSVELGRAFGVLKSRFNGVLSALDRFHIGIFVLSPNGAVVVRNLEAERLLDAADGISLSRAGQLHAVDDGQRAALKDAITQAIHTAKAKGRTAETHLSLARKSGDDDYLVEVSPIRDREELDGNFGGALVFVIDPTKTDVVSTEGLQQLYGLTNSESEICKLVAEGLETDEVADARNLTRETVRTYIKQILQKTGVKNRAQLVRRALNVNLPIDSSPES